MRRWLIREVSRQAFTTLWLGKRHLFQLFFTCAIANYLSSDRLTLAHLPSSPHLNMN
jgi:hypothetical protein